MATTTKSLQDLVSDALNNTFEEHCIALQRDLTALQATIEAQLSDTFHIQSKKAAQYDGLTALIKRLRETVKPESRDILTVLLQSEGEL